MGTAHFERVLKFLADGDISAAQKVQDQIEQVIAEMSDDRDIIAEMIARSQGTGGRKSSTAKSVPLAGRGHLRKVKPSKRSDMIRDFAFAIATDKDSSGTLNIKQIADAIEHAGYDLGSKVIGTVIANVLLKSAGWTRIGKGEFRYEAPA